MDEEFKKKYEELSKARRQSQAPDRGYASWGAFEEALPALIANEIRPAADDLAKLLLDTFNAKCNVVPNAPFSGTPHIKPQNGTSILMLHFEVPISAEKTTKAGVSSIAIYSEWMTLAVFIVAPRIGGGYEIPRKIEADRIERGNVYSELKKTLEWIIDSVP